MFNIIKDGMCVQYGTYELIADTIADLDAAPKTLAAGSQLFCIENSKTYILTPDKNWIEYTTSGSASYEWAEEINF